MCNNSTPSTVEIIGHSKEVRESPLGGGGVPVAFEQLKYTVKAKKKPLQIINGVSGHFASGKMTALMGPSGSGKSTLMDLIAGRKNSGTIEGDITFAGQKPSLSTIKHTCGYVEQFDTLIGELTVTQMLMYTAELKLPTSWTTAERKQRVDEVISTLGLQTCKDTVIGNALMRGISGGQAKRVNIGLALIHRPSVLFLDEPTSGLDSYMANEVVLTLSALAKAQRTVVSTIHSPTTFSFGLFDELLMLRRGSVVYDGPVGDALPYFVGAQLAPPPASGSFSLPEWLVDTTSGHVAHLSIGVVANSAEPPAQRDLAEAFEQSEHAKRRARERQALRDSSAKLDYSVDTSSQPGALRRLGVLLRYRMLTHYKSGEFLGPRIGDKVIFGLLILSLYWDIGAATDVQSIQSTASLLYFIVALCGYGAAAFVPSLTLDRPLFYRELADGNYNAITYYLSKFVEEAVLAAATSFFFGLIVFWACSLQGSFLVFVCAYYLTTMTGICLAYGIAAISPNMDAANALLPSYVTTCMYFGGLFILFDRIPDGWQWFSWTSFLRYSWGALMVNNFGGDANSTAAGGARVFIDGNGTALTVNEFYGMEGDIMGSVGVCLALAAVLMLVFATCGALSLTFVKFNTR